MKTILIYCPDRENLSKEKCLRTVVKQARGVPAFRAGRIKTGSPVTGLRFSVYRGTGPLLLCDLVEPLDPVQKTLDTHLLGSGYATPCSKRWVSQICASKTEFNSSVILIMTSSKIVTSKISGAGGVRLNRLVRPIHDKLGPFS
jgi:hypothetical protein